LPLTFVSSMTGARSCPPSVVANCSIVALRPRYSRA
jgi:hypothetical protein